MTRRTKALIIAGGLVAAVLAAPWLVPVARFIPALEAEASARVGEPVKIASLRLWLVPLPHVVATGISAGTAPLGRIARVTVHPSLLHLFSETKVLREIRLERAVVQQSLLERLGTLPPSRPGRSAVRIDRVVIDDGELRLRGATIRDLDAEIRLNADGRPREIRATSERGRLKVVARPDPAGALALEIAARAWTPPAGPAILFDRIDATALLTRYGIESRDFRAALYGGAVSGPLSLSWRPGWAISGEMSVKGVAVQPLAALFFREHTVSGRLSGDPRFAGRAKRAGALLPSLELASDFTVQDGVLHNIDLVAAARNPLAKQDARVENTPQTRFDELSGHLTVRRGGYHFSALQVASGLLRATGDISIAQDQSLDGRVNAELRGTASLLAVPLQVSGTVQDPQVRPTKSAVAGAVAGSVLLPGIGTALGLKAGQLTEKLFGGKKRSEQGGK
ncbi:MAG TPA: AsmA-like C-terminal region-containing protein [Burkholderiales bacterium]|jgi:uncharacterized protein involved in outer membrane biogenesis